LSSVRTSILSYLNYPVLYVPPHCARCILLPIMIFITTQYFKHFYLVSFYLVFGFRFNNWSFKVQETSCFVVHLGCTLRVVPTLSWPPFSYAIFQIWPDNVNNGTFNCVSLYMRYFFWFCIAIFCEATISHCWETVNPK